ncbi:MAG: LysR family transcriptional regulator [Chthoniobacter sp.]|nr:LysR family transcriptional regulator [Chthoniobacter sp.]
MTTIDSQYLRVFCALSRHLNMSRAAQELELTPSGISHCLKALESDLGCRLFERTSRKISLTPAGLEFRVEAEAILERMGSARSKLRSWIDWRRGGLRLAASTTACQYLLPLALREFRESFPAFTIQIRPCTAQEAIEAIGEEAIDLALFVEPAPQGGITFIPLAEDELQFLVHPLHPWTKRRSQRDVAKEKLILPERHSETHSLIDDYFRHDGVRIKPFIEIGNDEAIKEFVRLNLGIGLLPRWMATAEIEQGALACVSPGRRRLRRRWSILHNASRTLTFPESVFVNLCRNVAAGLMQSGARNEQHRDTRSPIPAA